MLTRMMTKIYHFNLSEKFFWQCDSFRYIAIIIGHSMLFWTIYDITGSKILWNSDQITYWIIISMFFVIFYLLLILFGILSGHQDDYISTQGWSKAKDNRSAVKIVIPQQITYKDHSGIFCQRIVNKRKKGWWEIWELFTYDCSVLRPCLPSTL